jgi:hypothetical protein
MMFGVSCRIRAWAFAIVATVMLVLGSPRFAGAQPPPPPAVWTPPVLPVALHTSEPGMIVELYAPDQKPEREVPLVRCQTPCLAQIAPGSYRVYVHASGDNLRGSRVINIEEPSHVTVTPSTEGDRGLGLGLGIGGIAAIGVGVVLLFVELIDSIGCIDSDCSDHANFAIPGLVLVVGGLVATPIGWVMFGKSFRPAVDVAPARDLRSARQEPSLPIRIRPVGPRRSLGLTVGVTF